MKLEAPHGTGVNLVERLGLDLLRRQRGDQAAGVHRWSDAERAQIRAVQLGAVLWAALAGAVSGALIGGAEIGFREPLQSGTGDGLLDQWRYWAAYLAVAVVVSVAEVLTLYWMMLRRVARISATAGLGLGTADIEQVMALGLSRAALEMPNPRSPVYGIDPYARVPRWKLLAYTVLYRLKVGATSFILRILLRRVLARATVRTLIPLIAVPVFAVWNALVTAWVMREAQIRAAGPLAVGQLGDWLGRQPVVREPATRQLVLQAVAESVVRARDAHPNFVLLLTRLLDEFGSGAEQAAPDWPQLQRHLEAASPEQRRVVLVVAAAAVVLNGRVRRHQAELLDELNDACAARLDRATLQSLRRGLLRGEGLPVETLAQRCVPAAAGRPARGSRSSAAGETPAVPSTEDRSHGQA